MSEVSVVTILVAVIGSGGFTMLTAWILRRVDRKSRTVTIQDLKPIVEKLDRDYEHFSLLDEQVRDIKLIVLRQCLFAKPRDRQSHESALQSGDEYLTMGGNGVGHVRLTWLQDQYRKRLDADDWDYTHDMKTEDV